MIYDTLMARYKATPGSDADKWQVLMIELGSLVAADESLPDQFRERLKQVNSAWLDGKVNREFLLSIKRECWGILESKHGTSVAIVDREDRAVRAMLGLLEPSGDAIAADNTADFVDAMLGPER